MLMLAKMKLWLLRNGSFKGNVRFLKNCLRFYLPKLRVKILTFHLGFDFSAWNFLSLFSLWLLPLSFLSLFLFMSFFLHVLYFSSHSFLFPFSFILFFCFGILLLSFILIFIFNCTHYFLLFFISIALL